MHNLRFYLLGSLTAFCFLFSSAQENDSTSFRKVEPAQGIFSDIIINPAFTGIFNGNNIKSKSCINKPFYNFRYYLHPFTLNVSYDMSFSENINHAFNHLLLQKK